MWAQGQKVPQLPALLDHRPAGYTGASNSQVVGVSSDGASPWTPSFYGVTKHGEVSVKIQTAPDPVPITSRSAGRFLEGIPQRQGGIEGAFEWTAAPRLVSWTDTPPLFGTH